MVLPTLTMAQARALAGEPFAAEMLRNAASYVVPIGWVAGRDAGGALVNSGTAFFVKTDRAIFGVTAGHVVDGFREASAVNPATVCHLMSEPIDLERVLIARGHDSDLATFAISEALLNRLEKQPCTGWPPRMPQQGRGIMYAGYPGVERRRDGPQTFSFGLYCAGSIANDVSDRYVSVGPLRADEVIDVMGLGLPTDDFDLGGMSGGPVLAIFDNGIVSWKVCAVISQGLAFGHCFLAERADLINDDGTIRRRDR